jgi:hypothetical protein
VLFDGLRCFVCYFQEKKRALPPFAGENEEKKRKRRQVEEVEVKVEEEKSIKGFH